MLTEEDVVKIVKDFRDNQSIPRQPISLMCSPSLRIPTHSNTNTPQIHFDQLAVIARHHHTVKKDLPPIDPTKLKDNDITYIMILQGIAHKKINPKLTRKLLQAQDDWIH